MGDLMSLIPWPWRIAIGLAALILIGGAAVSGGVAGYRHGHSVAETAGKATLAAERAEREKENAARALAEARAERENRKKQDDALARAGQLEKDMLAAGEAYARERAQLTRRIDDVAKAAAADCIGLSAAWVREFNAALGASGGPGTGNAGPGVSPAAGGTVPGAVSGVSQGQPLSGPDDILAHARDYGGLCRRYARQVEGWQETYSGWTGETR